MFSITHHESKKNLPARAHIVNPNRKTACGLPIDNHVMVDDAVAQRGIEAKAYQECVACRTRDTRKRVNQIRRSLAGNKDRRHARAS